MITVDCQEFCVNKRAYGSPLKFFCTCLFSLILGRFRHIQGNPEVKKSFLVEPGILGSWIPECR